MKINREDVVQAALTVERWCKEKACEEGCDCPFFVPRPFLGPCRLSMRNDIPVAWKLEEFLRKRGAKHD